MNSEVEWMREGDKIWRERDRGEWVGRGRYLYLWGGQPGERAISNDKRGRE